MKVRAILAFVLDRPGVLNKIAMLIRRRNFNVDTITVCATNRPGVSRMTITLREEDKSQVTQIIRQIEKTTEVIVAKELSRDESFWREVAMVKAELGQKHLNKLSSKYNFEIIHQQNQALFIMQISGTTKHIDNFLSDVGDDSIVEIARSGVTAMEK